MISRNRLTVLLVAICLHALPTTASKKVTCVPVTIVVVDPSGAVISGAAVEVNPSKRVANTLRTDRAGRVSLQLPHGKYELTVTAPAFAPAKRHIDISIAGKMMIEIQLRVCNGCGPNCSGPCVEVERDLNDTFLTQAPPIDTSIKPDAQVERSMPATPLIIQVMDPEGAVVPKALITLHSPETQCGETIVTGDNGRASTTARPGHYELVVTSDGFADAKQTYEVRAEAQTIHVVIHAASYRGPDVTPTDSPAALHLRMVVVDGDRQVRTWSVDPPARPRILLTFQNRRRWPRIRRRTS